MSEIVDVLIIGAGVVGLAIGRKLAQSGREVLVLEQHQAIGTETSSRNSQIIHAGIYYPTGSLKAQLCVRGKQLLYEYCRERKIPYRQTGKFIVATDESQHDELRLYQERASNNEAGRLEWYQPEDIRRHEPEITCTAGLYSPTSGIIDVHALMQNFEVDIVDSGGLLAFNNRVDLLQKTPSGVVVQVADTAIYAQIVINAAGLRAIPLAQQLGRSYEAHFAKGQYYEIAGKSPFQHPIYPLATRHGLGIHITVDLANRARLGPNIVWTASVDYSFESAYEMEFIESVRKYYPAVTQRKLIPGQVGVRPKLSGPALPKSDFVIRGPTDTGIPGYIELLGIESPGLTASMAIGDYIQTLIGSTQCCRYVDKNERISSLAESNSTVFERNTTRK